MSLRLSPRLREKIIRNYDGGDLSCRHLLELIESKVSPGARRGGNELANRMSRAKHRNMRAHSEGSSDRTFHYLVRIKDRGHHLRLDARGIVFQITDHMRRDLGVIPPWVGPGSAPSKLRDAPAGIRPDLWEVAMRSLHEHQAHPLLKKPHVITLVDFRINCNLPRLWTIDLRDGNVGFREPATHGKRSGPKNSPALRTSNVKGSNQSCVGAFITRHTRMSKAG